MDKENRRQLFHILVGIIALAVLLHFGRSFTTTATFFIIIIGTILMNLRLLGMKIALVHWFEERFERSDAPLPGWGSACYAAGVLMLLTFLGNVNEIAAAVFILAVGDGLSTIVGRKGRVKLPYNRGKTLEGALAFFVSSLPAWYFIGPAAIPLAAVAGLAETLPKMEDNLVVPLVSIAFFLVV